MNLSARRFPYRGPAGLFACLLTVGVIAVLGLPAIAAEGKKDNSAEAEVDYLALAAKMIHDDKYDRAARMLAEVDTKMQGVDLAKYHVLMGLVAQHRELHSEARKQFELSFKHGQKEKVVYLYIAQAAFGMKDYRATLEALDKAGPKETGKLKAVAQMRAQAHWELKEPGKAIASLDAGKKAFPQEADFERVKLFYLIDLGLYQEATRVSASFLERKGTVEKDYVTVGAALRSAKQYDRAQRVLEEARLRYPDSEDLLVQLAHTYLDAGHPLIAAMLFEDASHRSLKYALEAGELFKQAGRTERALSLNERVPDQQKKMKQRLSILLATERYELMSGMAPRLARLGLMADDNIRYAIAYAYYKTGQFNEAERELKLIRSPELFEAAVQIRKAVESCRTRGWECSN